MSGVRDSPCVLVATVTKCTTRSCAPYIGALLTSVPASVSLLSLCGFSPLRLCTSAPLRLCSALLPVLLWSQHCSRRSSALVSVLLFSLLWSSRSLLCTRLCSAFDSALHSPLLLASALHLCLLSSRPHSSRDLYIYNYLVIKVENKHSVRYIRNLPLLNPALSLRRACRRVPASNVYQHSTYLST